jgi:transposase
VLDEFGTHLGLTRRYARAPRGRRAHGAAPCNPDPNVTLIFGLRLDGVVAPWVFEAAMDGAAYTTYARTQLAPSLRPGDVVLADNLGAHRSTAARAAIEATGATYVLLPPYSPDLSPIENAGSQVKSTVRNAAPRTVPQLYRALGRALRRVTRDDAYGYFAHAGYVPRRARGLPSDTTRRPPL